MKYQIEVRSSSDDHWWSLELFPRLADAKGACRKEAKRYGLGARGRVRDISMNSSVYGCEVIECGGIRAVERNPCWTHGN